MHPLESLHRLSLILGASLDRAQESAVFLGWLKAEVRPRLAALFVAGPGRDSLRLVAFSKRKKLPAAPLPLGFDPWEWLQAQKISLPRGERCAFPIVLEGELFGLLTMVSAQKGEALKEEERLLDLALAYLAPILRNIEKHESVERLVEERTAQLRASEERYRAISELISDYAYAFRVEEGSRLVREWVTGESFTRLTGYTPQEMDERGGWSSIIHPEDMPIALARARRLLAGKHDVSEFRIIRKDGEIRWLRDHGHSVWDETQKRVVRIYGAAEDITIHRQAEEAIKNSERRLLALIENGLDYISLLDAEGNLLWENPSSTNLLGYGHNTFLGRSILDLVHPEDQEWIRPQFARLAAEPGSRQSSIFRLRRADGNWRWVEAVATNLLNDPAVGGIVINYRDIGGRIQSEQALRAAEHKYRAIFEGAVEGIFQSTPEGRFLTVNPALARMWGYDSPEDLIASVTDIARQVYADPADRENFKRLMEEQGEVRCFEYPARRKDGSVMWVSENARAIRDETGTLLYYEGNVEDITERKLAEQALRESEEKFRLLAESTLTGIYLIQEGRFRYVNRALAQTFGYEAEELMNRLGPLDLTHPDDHPRVLENIRRRVEGEVEDIRYEFRGLRKDGSIIFVEVHGRRIEFEGKIGVIGTLADVTLRVQAEAALKQSEEQYRTLIEQLPAVIYVDKLDGKGTTLFVSPQIETILGVPMDEWLREDISFWLALIHPQDRSRVEKAYRGIVETGQSYDIEYRIFARDGRLIWMQDKGRVLKNAAGELLLHGVMFDITRGKQLERELEAEAMLAQALSESLELQAVLEHLLEAARHAIPVAEKGSVLLMEADGRLHIRALNGYTDPRLNDFAFASDSGYSARAVRERQPLLITNARTDASIRYDGEIEEARNIQSAIAAPLILREQVIGVLSLDSTRQAAFTSSDLNLLKNFAATAALVIERARLFEQTQRRLSEMEALYESSLRLGRLLDTRKIGSAIVEILSQRMNWDHAVVRLRRGESDELEVIGYGAPGLSPEELVGEIERMNGLIRRVGEGMTGWVIQHGVPARSGNLPSDPRYIETYPGIRSGVYVPIWVGERPMGAIGVESEMPEAFDEHAERFLFTLAAQAASALQNARLFETVQSHLAEQRVLRAVASVCADADDENALVAEITNIIGESLYPDHFGFLLLDPDGSFLRPHPSYRGVTIREVSGKIPLAAGIAGQVAASGKPRRIADVRNEEKYLEITAATRSELCVPILAGERVLGVINAESHEVDHFSEQDEDLLTNIASQAATALERIRLHRETRRRADELAALYESSRSLAGSTSLDEVLNTIAESIHSLLGTAGAGLYLYDPSTETLEVKLSTHSTVPLGTRLALGEGLAGKVAQSRRPTRIDDYASWEERSPKYEGIPVRAVVEAPLVYQDELIGVLVAHEVGESERRFTEADERLLMLFAAQAAAAVQNVRLFEETHRRAEETAALLEASLALPNLDLRTALQTIGERAKDLFAADGCRVFLLRPGGQTLRCVLALGEDPQAYADLTVHLGQGVTGSVAVSGEAEIVNDMSLDPRAVVVPGTPDEPEAIMFAPLKEGGYTTGVISIRRVGLDRPFRPRDLELLKAFASMAASAVSNARLFDDIQQRLQELETLQSLSAALRKAHTVQEMLPVFVAQAAHAVGAQAGSIFLREESSGEWVSQGWLDTNGKWMTPPSPMRHAHGEGVTGLVGASGEAYITGDWRTDATNRPLPGEMGFLNSVTSGMALPLRAEDRVIGVMHIWYEKFHTFTEDEKRLLTAISDMAGNSLQRARLHEETQRRVNQLQALQTIDRAISASLDLRLSLNILLEQTLSQLNADAAGILLYHQHTLSLEYAAGRGFRGRAYQRSRLRLGEGIAGRAAQNRQLVQIHNLAEAAEPFVRSNVLAEEGFFGYFAAPLITKGQLVGVLEIFHRSPFHPDKEWLKFLEAFAQQAAIAIDNAQLFENLQRSNLELTLAYDKTIEGWSKALDLRDKETEGHTQRVASMTVELARILGMSEIEILHIHRGCLLHDIGKMGVPDRILFKEGPLTEEEWNIMRQHPRFAFEMLSPISYLRPALDIPYCHHEKWDGTGYPQGLKGEQIPLAARIFAVVDVWDALTSDRPYRPAWTKDKALEYIRSQAGKHFDPRVVEAFLGLVGQTAPAE